MPSTVTYPLLLPKPFASNPLSPSYGGKNVIPTGAASPLASLDDGFPVATMTPISAGGTPPEGKDFNGILNTITAFQTWANAGGRFKYDSPLAADIGGYPLGAVLLLNDDVSEVICTIDGNANDPNTNMSGWAPYSGALSGAGFYQLDVGAVNAYSVTRSPVISSYVNGMLVTFKAIHTNTGASTLNAGPGAVPLKRNDGAALVAGDVVNGSIYVAIYDGATSAFVLTARSPSQVSASIFTTRYDVTGARAYSTTYTNSTGKPMFVAFVGQSTGGGSNIQMQVDGVDVFIFGQPSGGAATSACGMVPPGSTYRIINTVSAVTILRWTETY